MNYKLIFAAALIIISSSSAWAGIVGYHASPPAPSPSTLLTQVASKCSRLIKDGSSEYIYNACSACRIVNITRKRPGIAIPVLRTYNVQGKSKFPVPFKGPGRSRITIEQPCEGEAGASENLVNPGKKPAQAEQQCVGMEKVRNGDIALVNRCTTCRAVAVELALANGQSLGRRYFKLSPSSVKKVNPEGAAQAGLIGEVACTE